MDSTADPQSGGPKMTLSSWLSAIAIPFLFQMSEDSDTKIGQSRSSRH